MKTTLSLLFAFFLSTFLFSSCKKNPDSGKIKYVFSSSLTTPIEFTIDYNNDFGQENSETVTSTYWEKSCDYTKMGEWASFTVNGFNPSGNLPNFTGTLKIYKNGELVNELQVETNNEAFFQESLGFYLW
jgi:hypothetical protein